MTTQPEALWLADALDRYAARFDAKSSAAAELRRLHEANKELLEALKLAVRQNGHDMLMTGDELRQCETAIAKHGGET